VGLSDADELAAAGSCGKAIAIAGEVAPSGDVVLADRLGPVAAEYPRNDDRDNRSG